MKRIVLACLGFAATAALAGSASAADLQRRNPPPYNPPPAVPYYSPVYNWTGLYVGINAGAGWGSSNWDSLGSIDLKGGMVGGTAGYNWQGGPWVLGVEGDIDWSGIDGNSTNTLLCPLGCRTANSWLGTVRGRVGYGFDRIMPYLTAGIAFGNIKASSPGFAGVSETHAGWTVGAGLEVALLGRWTAKAEYLYVDLGEDKCGLNCGFQAVDNVNFKTHILRGGLNYRF